MTFTGCSSSFQRFSVAEKFRKKKAKGWTYLSQSLTFLQLLLQQPADINAVTETKKGREGETSLKCSSDQRHCPANVSIAVDALSGWYKKKINTSVLCIYGDTGNSYWE